MREALMTIPASAWKRPGQVGDVGVGIGTSSITSAPAATSPASRQTRTCSRRCGVLADQDAALALTTEGHTGRPTQLEDEFGSDRELANRPADTVGTEIFSAHCHPTSGFCGLHGGDHAHRIDSPSHVMGRARMQAPVATARAASASPQRRLMHLPPQRTGRSCFLRDTPTNSGRPSTCSAPRCLNRLRLCAQGLGEPESRVEHD